ncbi:MAG: recombinase zinc beta ribbon domain-containing protein, partial [Gemmatimonadetes bacterium]|nr:recombinase zinc beta ribbon domain-containing protein [Gemmatimonadota bacterium]
EELPREQWTVLLPDAHPGYIGWEQFEANLKRLRDNAQANGWERRKSPPREGPALLQGLVVCGVCGQRMTVRYHTRKAVQHPEYVCQREGIDRARPKCQTIAGVGIDQAIGELLVQMVTPVTLEVALKVQVEFDARIDEADALRRKSVERVRQEADLARRRFMEVDPGNRLVVDVLEAEWNEKLRGLHDAQEQFEQRRAQDRQQIGDEQRRQVLALVTDFPRLWNDPKTPQQQRKRMVRLLIEDVTLTKNDGITVSIRFRGGATTVLDLPIPPNAWEMRQTSPQVVAEIDALLRDHTDVKIASILNDRGRLSGEGKPFHARIVQRLRRTYALQTRYDRLRDAGMLTLEEMATVLSVSTPTVKIWRDHGLLHAHVYNDKQECLYEHPGDHPPTKAQGRKLAKRGRISHNQPNRSQEVQCEA